MDSENIPLLTDSVLTQPMPEMATALRERLNRVVERWNSAVSQAIPEADNLTIQEVRNSIPRVLQQIITVFESSSAQPIEKLLEITRIHGVVRFHESYNIRELLLEYRILRRILSEEIDAAVDGLMSSREWIAIETAVDIAMNEAVVAFVDYQSSRLKSAADAETKFLAFLAHDMRNSLNSILLTMQWIEQSIESGADLRDAPDALRSARESATSTIAGMERLLQAERLRHETAARRESVNVATVIQEVVSQYRLVAEQKGLGIEITVPADAEIQSDASLLVLVIQNLLGNAIKYSERGTVRVEAEKTGSAADAGWCISVADEGRGIARETLPLLFDAFTRGDTHGQPGVGLGLFIASRAAKLLGSRLAVESEVGKGARFSLVLRDLPTQG